MKLPNLIPTAAALCLTALPLRAADDPDADAELGAFRVEYIEADLAVVHRLLLIADGGAIRRGLHDEVAAGRARLIDMGAAVARLGTRNKARAVSEWLYPIEMDPPEMPMEFTGPVDPSVDTRTNLTPTAYETRDLGMTFECILPFSITAERGRRWSFATELTCRTGDTFWGRHPARIEQPDIHAMTDAAVLPNKPGKWQFLGIHLPPSAQPGIEPPGARRIVSLVKFEGKHFGFEAGANLGPAQREAHLTAELIAVPAARAAALLDDHFSGRDADATGLREAVGKLLASGEATLRHTLAMPARSGQRAKTSSGSEWIYGIEGDPPELPQTVAGPIGAGIDMISEHSYTAFETGNTGVTFEAEVTGRIEHGGRIPVKMAVEWTRYIRTVEIAEGESMGFQPVFFTQALGLDTILWHGRPALAGVVREIPADPGTGLEPAAEYLFAFVRATERGIPPGRQVAPPAPAPMLAVRMEILEADHALIHRWATDPATDSDAGPMRAALLAQLAAGKAVLVDQSWGIGQQGKRADVGANAEFSYPIEFDPPEMPNELVGPIDPALDIITDLTGTALETRNLGLTVRFLPKSIPRGGWPALQLSTELACREGENFIGIGASREQHSIINHMNADVAIHAEPGRWKLLAIHAPIPGEMAKEPTAGRRLAVFVRTDPVFFPESGDAGATDAAFAGSEPPAEPDLRLVAEFIEVPAASMPALLDAHPISPEDASLALYNAARTLRGAIHRQTATCELHEMSTRSHSGDEFIYPIEFAPPDLPSTLKGPIDPRINLVSPITPTAFETRDLGVQLRAKLLRQTPGIAEAAAGVVWDRILRLTEFGAGKSIVQQPLIFRQSAKCATTLPLGKPLLIAIQRETETDLTEGLKPAGRAMCVFVRAMAAE